jgi:diaminohydroxyphosphoribosylaminopyrimidine deaminase/5-amino-6-(5-phosphoribosylamino)uracil reductase
MLKKAGIEVIENVLQKDCLKINKRFITYHTQKRPYIFLKWAQTKNGFMDFAGSDLARPVSTKYWITNEALRVWTHKLRNEEQAFLIGYNTLTNDNPQLTNRLYGSNQPQRFVLYYASKPVINNTSFTFLDGTIEEVLNRLHTIKIQSVVVEGGKKTIQKFIDINLWDEIFVLNGTVEWESGVEAPKLLNPPDCKINVESETIAHYFNKVD